jgi:protein SCO1
MMRRTAGIAGTFLSLCFSLAGSAQMKTPANIGIDEKLGSRVALDAPLQDESGHSVTLGQYVDKPTILMFNYFRCPGICPVLINSVVDVINRIKAEPGRDFRVIAVSFDPTDRPELAREKKANYLNQLKKPFSPDNWHFLTGTAEDTRAVADSAGFNYRQQGDMYMHPGALIILTPKGVISRYIYGVRFVPADVEIAIQEAAGGQVLPTISRALAFCYVSDPQGRGRVFSVTRFAGAATLVIAGVFVIFLWIGKSSIVNRKS